MVKRFSIGEIKKFAGKVQVTKPIGIMDRRWNLAIETLVLQMERVVDLEKAGYDSEDNLRPIKIVKKGYKLP
jgi:hypothetical protein